MAPMNYQNVKVEEFLLDREDSALPCKRLHVLALDIPDGCDPVEFALQGLATRGLDAPQAARQTFSLPTTPYVALPCRDEPQLSLLDIESDDTVLWTAVMLGLCTRTRFDPARPVVWTSASLRRRLALYQTGGFYAVD
jgi:hypothetical protein